MATFNDSRCTGSGVCLIDPLLFTCEFNEVFLLRVKLPNGDQEVTSLGDTAEDVALPGVTVQYLNVTPIDESIRNYVLTFSIMNASLLDGGEIICDDTTGENVAKARCKLHAYGMSCNVLILHFYVKPLPWYAHYINVACKFL